MPKPKLWLPYKSRRYLISIQRCPDCGWHPKTQGHHPDCPTAPSDSTVQNRSKPAAQHQQEKR